MNENIYTAILEVMKSVRYVQKEKSRDVNYTLKTEESILDAIRPEMIKNNIIMFPVDVKDYHHSTFEAGKFKNIWNRTVATHVYRFYHVLSGTYTDVATIGDGADTGDKAGNKGMTTSKKYALLETFLLVTGDDPDTTQSPTQTTKEDKKAPVSQKAPAAQKAASVDVFETVKSSNGELYKDLPIDKLSFMFSALVDNLKKDGLTQQNRDELELKRDAAQYYIKTKKG